MVPTSLDGCEDSMRQFRVSSEPGAGVHSEPFVTWSYLCPRVSLASLGGTGLPGLPRRLFPLSWLDGLLPTGALHPLTAQRAR